MVREIINPITRKAIIFTIENNNCKNIFIFLKL